MEIENAQEGSSTKKCSAGDDNSSVIVLDEVDTVTSDVENVDRCLESADDVVASEMLDLSVDSRNEGVVSELDVTQEADGDASFDSVDESRDDVGTDVDMPEIIEDISCEIHSRRSLNVNTSIGSLNNSLNLSRSSMDLSKDAAALAGQKCSNCHQRLNVVNHYQRQPGPGKGETEVVNSPKVNIMMDEEDQRALQY